MHRTFATAILGTGIALLGVACSDDDAPTTEAFCAELRSLPDDGGPTDEFFAEHPDPTLEDWAEGLPDIIDKTKAARDGLADVEPSEELADEHQALIDAIDVMVQSFEDALDAAEAGDQAEYDRLEAENQGVNGPALGEAFEALGSACGLDG